MTYPNSNREYDRACRTLPYADGYFVSSTAETFVYAAPPVVVKIFFEKNSAYYHREKRAYETLGTLDCSSFAVLYASGYCVEDGRPFLILSNEGSRVDWVTDSDK